MSHRHRPAPIPAVRTRYRLSAGCAALALLLAACGGSTLDTGTGTGGTGAPAYAGVVIDGPIEGAAVFLDLDGDFVRDDDEPQSAPSDATGRFRIDVSATDPARLKGAQLVVHVPEDAKDADDGGRTLAEAGRAGFTLTAPAPASPSDRAVLSPLTTLVAAELRAGGGSLDEAHAAVRARLGLPASADLTGDFVAARDATLGPLARAAAVALGEAQRRIAQAATGEGGVPVRQQLEAAAQAVQRQLPGIADLLGLAAGGSPPGVAAVLEALSAPAARAALVDVLATRIAGTGATRRYVVVLADTVADPVATAQDLARGRGVRIDFTYTRALKGFAASMPATASDAFLAAMRAHPLVERVEPDLPLIAWQAVQPGAPWGLDRIDQRDLPLTGTYAYGGNGAGVRAYVLDTGIRAGHAEFGARLLAGWSAIADGNGTNDCNGHGTHVAGTIGGSTWGVAKGVSLVPVRVLDCAGIGALSTAIAGLDWVAANARQPAVVNLSLGGTASAALDAAVTGLLKAGLPVVVAAGNVAADACDLSPARVPLAITVGATTVGDARASYSNFGACVDLFAPGSGITSAGRASDTATAQASGTSMAAAHVAGLAALRLATAPAATPAQLADAIYAAATPDRIGDAGRRSPNLLLHTVATPQP